MLRLVTLPFSLFLLVVCVGLVAVGLGLVAEGTQPGDGQEGSGSLLDVDIGGRSDQGSGTGREGATLAGVSLIGFGILGAIGAVALLVAALAERRAPEAVPAVQQQQQVVVVTDGDARVDTTRRG